MFQLQRGPVTHRVAILYPGFISSTKKLSDAQKQETNLHTAQCFYFCHLFCRQLPAGKNISFRTDFLIDCQTDKDYTSDPSKHFSYVEIFKRLCRINEIINRNWVLHSWTWSTQILNYSFSAKIDQLTVNMKQIQQRFDLSLLSV